MTYEEFIERYPPRPGDEVIECDCGSCDCPGWKLYNFAREKAMSDAMDKLPQILIDGAFEAGRKAAEDRERLFWEAFCK